MRIVAVSRVFNEDDIIEAFIRHHAAMVDHHIFIDSGSIDHTIAIISRLHAEGISLSLHRNDAVIFQEEYINTFLYQLAWRVHGADWVVHLDCDEFIDPRHGGGDLRAMLASVPPALPAICLEMIDYRETTEDDPGEAVVPVRLGHRVPAPSDIWKIFLRGNLSADLVVAAGNHHAMLGGEKLAYAQTSLARLAHYPQRAIWQVITKIVIGRLRVLASAEAAASNHSDHYNAVFETLLHRPADLLLNQAHVAAADATGLVLDPIAYRGGPLRYSPIPDYRMKAVQSLLSYADRLARHHAKLLEITKGDPQDLKIEKIL